MKLTISFLHLDHTPALDEKIKEKTQRLEKYLDQNAHVKWSCYVKNNLHYAELTLTGKIQGLHATANTDSLYKTIDKVVDKIEKQLRKKKDKRVEKIHRKSNLVLVAPVEINDNYEYDEEHDETNWNGDDWSNAA